MAKKHFSNSKNLKTTVISVVLAGVTTFAIIGGTVIANLTGRQDSDNPLLDDKLSSQVTEITIPTPEQFTPNSSFTPETDYKDPASSETQDVIEDIEVKDFSTILSKLTAKSIDYCDKKMGAGSEFTITGITSVQVDKNKGTVVMMGQLDNGANIKNCIITLTNNDAKLKIYNLSVENISKDFVDSFNEILDNEYTDFAFKQKEAFILSNEDEIVYNMLLSRRGDLEALNSKDPNVLNEIAHINDLLKENSNVAVSVLLNNRTYNKEQKQYTYSFSIVLNTGNYLYTLDESFACKSSLTNNALRQNIENCLQHSTNFDIKSVSNVQYQNEIYIINSNASTLKPEQTVEPATTNQAPATTEPSTAETTPVTSSSATTGQAPATSSPATTTEPATSGKEPVAEPSTTKKPSSNRPSNNNIFNNDFKPEITFTR